jgi:hypothetical protein
MGKLQVERSAAFGDTYHKAADHVIIQGTHMIRSNAYDTGVCSRDLDLLTF